MIKGDEAILRVIRLEGGARQIALENESNVINVFDDQYAPTFLPRDGDCVGEQFRFLTRADLLEF